MLVLLLLAHPGVPHELRELDAELRRHPDRAPLYLERAEFLRTIARYDEALTDLDLAEALGAEVELARARIHETRGEHLLAEYWATQALSRDPTAHAFFLRGRAREQNGRTAEAVEDYRAALLVGSSNELFLAEARALVALGRREEAVRSLSVGLLATGSIVLRRELIRIAPPEEALELLQPVLQQAPVKTEWLLLRAGALSRLGREEEAGRDRRRAVEEAERIARKRPAPAILLSRARAYDAVGRHEDAARDRREAESRWKR